MPEPDTQPWTDKYRPETLSDIQGNTAAVDRLKDWLTAFPEDRQPRLLLGPAGVGKTSAIEVLADYADYDLLEFNTSDFRSSEAVEEMATTIRNTSADGERTVILLDEADSWHHATHKQPLYDALERPANPVFITANDKYDTPSGIVRNCEIEKFRLQKRSIKAKLKKIRDAEGLDISDEMLDSLADRPDLRSAINDLQVYAELGDVPDDDREFEISEWDMVDNLLTGTPERGQHDPSWALLWLDECTRREYRGIELAMAYEALSRADELLGRAQDRGYRHWKYAGALVDAVAHLRRTEPYYDDEVGRDVKSFPSWLQMSEPSATDESRPEAVLYRELTDYEDGLGDLHESFVEFRHQTLPILQDLEQEEKYELILTHRLSPLAMEALGVQESQYEGWLEEESPERGEWGGTTQDASAW